MALDLNNVLANFGLDQIYGTKFPAGSLLRIRTGAVAGAENADSGTVLSTITTPASPWATASGGSKAKSGTWQDGSAAASGTAAHFRLSDSGGTYCEEGTITATGGGGDLTLDNTNIATAQVVTVNSYTRSM
jgi:hypothetical protein